VITTKYQILTHMANNDVLALVRDKQAQIAKLQSELDEVRQLLLGEQTALTLPNQPKRPAPHAGRGRRRRKHRESSVSWAADVVAANNAPLHVDEMIRRIFQKVGKEVDKQTLVSNLSRLVKAKRGWQRTGPNTFGLTGGK